MEWRSVLLVRMVWPLTFQAFTLRPVAAGQGAQASV